MGFRPHLSYMSILTSLGLTSGLLTMFDAGDINSMASASTQNILCPTGNLEDWTVGQSASVVQSTDAPFYGTPGALTADESFYLDGPTRLLGYNTLSANLSPMYRDNAKFSYFLWFYWVPQTTSHTSLWQSTTESGTSTDKGMNFDISSTQQFRFYVGNGSGPPAANQSSNVLHQYLLPKAWNAIGLILDEALGTQNLTFFCNGRTEVQDCTYVTPQTSGGGTAPSIGSVLAGHSCDVPGNRVAMAALWNTSALTAANFNSIYNYGQSSFAVVETF